MSDINVKNMSMSELQKLQKDIGKALAVHETSEKKKAITIIEAKAKSFGYSLLDLIGKSAPQAQLEKKAKAEKTPRKQPRIKYRNKENPEQTWTGMGRRPIWLVIATDAGAKHEDFLVQD